MIKEFMRNLMVFSVLSAFCIHLLPNKSYQRYARFSIGLVYICMMLDVLGEFLDKTLPGIAF